MFDPVLLSTLVAVADTRSFTRAAERLGISQPTVSQHVQRLEKAAGRTLVTRDTRDVTLTDNGDAMVGFARTILEANALAVDYFTGSASRGRIRFGAADDLAATQVPRVLRQFRHTHPSISLELTVNQSHVLYRRLKAGHLDLIFVKRIPDAKAELIPEIGTVVQTDAFTWAAHPNTTWDESGPVPLVVYNAPVYSRQRAIDALEQAGRTWRITCTAREVNGLLAALRAGLGVAPYPRTLLPDDLVRVDKAFDLPEIGMMEFALYSNPRAPEAAVKALTDAIMKQAIRLVV